jgi:hypothetical protein
MLKATAIDRRDDQTSQHRGIRTGALARAVVIAAVCGALAAVASPAWAEQGQGGSGAARSGSTGDGWEFEIAPYGWFISLPGTITAFNQSNPIDIGFDEIWKHLHFAFFLDADIRKDDFGFFSDLTYSYLGTKSEGRFFDSNTKVRLVIFDFAFYYEALKLDLGSGSSAPRLRLQPFVGGRYFYMGLDIDAQPVVPVLQPRFLQPRVKTAAPVLGLRGFLDINDRWNLSFVGDGGGFGVDGMHSTWQAELLGGYRFHPFSKLDLNLMVGYKGLGIDHSGAAVGTDLIFHGPVLRLGSEF